MTDNPDPDRIPDAIWEHLWMDVKRALKEVKRGVPRNGSRLGYHLTRDEHPPTNYSVQRTVDKLGPSDKVSAIDWVFPSAKGGDYSHIVTITERLLAAYDNLHDGRIGSHNVAEIFGTLDGKTVVGRVHGRYGSNSDIHLYVVHLALARKWAENRYVCRAVLSVVTGESHDDWFRREHARA